MNERMAGGLFRRPVQLFSVNGRRTTEYAARRRFYMRDANPQRTENHGAVARDQAGPAGDSVGAPVGAGPTRPAGFGNTDAINFSSHNPVRPPFRPMNTTPTSSKTLVILDWLARILAAAILLQTLFFKFTGSAESVYIFTAVGQEPWGRYGSGVVELIASILLLLPRTAAFGALLALGTMSGAIFFHLTKLGLVVQDDGGLLFGLAIVVLACAAFTLWLHRAALLRFLPQH